MKKDEGAPDPAVTETADARSHRMIDASTAWRADADELARVAAGDQSAFRRLYDAHHTLIVRLAYGVLQDREQARDVAHDVLVKLLRAAPSWQPRAQIATWLRTVTMRECFSWRRRLRLRRASDVDVDETAASERVDSDVERVRERRAFRRALATLSPRDRAIVVLHVDHELAHADVAVALGMKEGAVRTALHRAIERLKTAVDEGATR